MLPAVPACVVQPSANHLSGRRQQSPHTHTQISTKTNTTTAATVPQNPDGLDPTTPGSRRASYMVRYPTGRRPSQLDTPGSVTSANSEDSNVFPPTPKKGGPNIPSKQKTPKSDKVLTPVSGIFLPEDGAAVSTDRALKNVKETGDGGGDGEGGLVSDSDSSSEDDDDFKFIPKKRTDRSMSVHAIRLRTLIKDGHTKETTLEFDEAIPEGEERRGRSR